MSDNVGHSGWLEHSSPMRPPQTPRRAGGINRRQHPRLVGPYPGQWRRPDGPPQRARVGQVSFGGCYVSAIQPPNLGQRVVVTLDVTDAAMKVDLPGTVVRSKWSDGFGVKFDALDPQDAGRFRTLLDSIRSRTGNW